ncbi:MAG: menaquinone biosynthesis decarboxylase [Polyangiales bacterium]
MAYDGLSEFVRELENASELVRVRAPVDPHLELAAIADRVVKAGGPALLFENVVSPGQRAAGFPLLINAYGSRRRMSLALGVGDFEDHARAIERLLAIAGVPGAMRETNGGRTAALARILGTVPDLAHVPPRGVTSGPCQEVVHVGDDVDLDALPIITAWPADGGPFITLPVVFTKDPERGDRNVGMYRMQKLDRRTTAMHWQVHKTGARHFQSAKKLGVRLEVAVVLGGDPAYAYAATAPLPDGLDELLLAGFLRKRAVRLVPCKTIGLEVPADADFVLEGYVDPSEPLVDEGPFGDHTGYYTPVEPFPRFHVTAVTHRRDAIYPTTIVGPPPMEDQWLGKATERLFLPLLKLQLPEIVDMNLPVEGAFHNLCIVSIKKTFPFHGRKIAHSIWGAGQMMFTKAIVVVDDDVNVQDVAQVAFRVLANIDPKRDLSFAEGPSDQLCHAGDLQNFGGKVVIDATKKWREEGYTRVWPEVCVADADTSARLDARWAEYGLAGRSPSNGHAPSRGPLDRIVAAAREMVR